MLTVLTTSSAPMTIFAIIGLIAVIAVVCFGGWYLLRRHEFNRKEKRQGFISDVLHGRYDDEQIIHFMAAPIGPRMDISLIHAVASSKRLTPKLRAWIFNLSR